MDTFVQQLINGLNVGAIYALIALGYTMVYGILRLINFAHGDVYMVGAFAGYYLANLLGVTETGGSPLRALIVLLGAMLICAALGVVIERGAYKPVRRHPRISALITAIGVSLLLENLGLLLFGSNPKFFPQIIAARRFTVAGVIITNHQILVIGVSFALMLVLRWIVLGTRVGRS